MSEDMRLLYVSPSGERMNGYKASERVGRDVFELLSPEGAAELRRAFQEAAEHPDRAVVFVGQARRKDGRRFYIESRIMNMLGDPDVRAFVVNTRDVTERKVAELELAEGRAAMETGRNQLHAIINATSDRIYHMSRDGRILVHNEAASARHGRADMTGLRLEDLAPEKDVTPARNMIEQVISRGAPERIELERGGKYSDVGVFPVFDAAGAVESVVMINRDITERKKIEDGLRITNSELASLKHAIDQHSYVAITDIKGRIIYVNDSFCRRSGYSREQLVGSDHRIINSGTHSKDFFRDMWETIKTGRVWHGEICNRARDGALYWVDTAIVPVLDTDGRPYQYVAIRTDITERYQMMATLRESEERSRTIIEASPDGIWIHKDGVVHMVNAAAVKMLGYDQPEDIIGRSLFELIPPEFVSQVKERIAGAASSGGTPVREFALKHRDGSHVPVEVSGASYRLNDSVWILAVMRDISARLQAGTILRESEARLRKSQQMAKLGSWELELATKALVWSDEMASIFEIDPASPDLYQRSRSLLLPEDAASITAAFQAAVEQWKPYEMIHHLLMPDGRVKVVEVHGEIRYDDAGRPVKSVGTLQDITERHAIEEKLRRSVQEKEVLESQNRIVSMSLIHERLYQSGDLGQLPFQDYAVDLAKSLFVAYGVDSSRIALVVNGGGLTLNVSDAVPCGLIITEIVSNALKHAFPGGARGAINVILEKNADRVTLLITDNGCGLPSDLDQRIESSLGLRLIERLSRQIGGTMSRSSSPAGTRYEIALSPTITGDL
ncbi:MAG: PAS domain S-box protein [Spirochaetia bacterium]|nr:PAS domain S-box protein [Spirochaetia bacterium]